MGNLALLPARKVIQKLRRAGFSEMHQRGSHLYLGNEENKTVTVPIHGSKDIPIGTLYNIIVKQAGLTVDEFNEL